MSFLTARLGPLPVWLWTLIVAGGAWLFFHFRGKSSTNNSVAASNGVDLTNQPATLYPYSSSIYVNVPQPTGTGAGSSGSPTPTPKPGTAPVPPQPPRWRIPLPETGGGSSLPAPPPRTASVTYPVSSGDVLTRLAERFPAIAPVLYRGNASTLTSTAQASGFNNTPRVFRTNQLVIPG